MSQGQQVLSERQHQHGTVAFPDGSGPGVQRGHHHHRLGPLVGWKEEEGEEDQGQQGEEGAQEEEEVGEELHHHHPWKVVGEEVQLGHWMEEVEGGDCD